MRRFACLLTVVLCLGCQTANKTSRTKPQTPGPLSDAESEEGFSIGKIWKAVTFQSPNEEEDETTSILPQEVIQLGNVITSISARAQELSPNDPPEVTRQKAQAILEALQPWDSILAAGRSVGMINDASAATLNAIVERLKSKVQQLVDYVPNPQTIQAVKYLAGQLRTAYSGTIGAFSRFVGS